MPGSFIRRARERFGLTVTEVARAAGLGVSELMAVEAERLKLEPEQEDDLVRALVVAIEPLAVPAAGLDDPGLIVRQRGMSWAHGSSRGSSCRGSLRSSRVRLGGEHRRLCGPLRPTRDVRHALPDVPWAARPAVLAPVLRALSFRPREEPCPAGPHDPDRGRQQEDHCPRT